MTIKGDSSQPAPWCVSERWMLFITALVVFASRLPWVMAGPGSDPDSFRVLNVAMTLAETGEYSASRLPGYPAHEYLVAALVHLGPIASNMLSAFCSAVAFVFFALILRRSDIQLYLSGAVAFAFTPVVYINSTATIDYVPAIACVLAAIYWVLGSRVMLAGVCLGLAVGFRITSGAMVLPLVLWIILNSRQKIDIHAIFCFAVTVLLTAGMCFAPVLLQYGLGFFTFHDNIGYPSWMSLFNMGVLAVWGQTGVLALFGLCLIMPLHATRIKAHLAERRTLALVVLAAVAIVLYVVAFLRLPHESGYLVPVVPLTLVLFGLFLPPSPIRVLALALVLSSFITIDTSGIAWQGPIIQDHHTRIATLQRTRAIVAAVERIPRNAIVVAGRHLPAIGLYIQSVGGNLNQYVYLIANREACTKYQDNGQPIFFLAGINNYNKKVYGIDLRDCHAQQLNVSPVSG